MHRDRFILIPLVNQLRLVTKGNDISSPVYFDLDVPDFSKYLPCAEGLTLFTLIETPTTNFRAGVYFRSGFNRNNEGSPIQLGANVPSSGGNTESKRHTEYTTVGNFELHGRLQIAYGNSTGSANETGVISAALGIKVWGA